MVPYFGVDLCGFDVYTIFRSLIFVEQVLQLVGREFLPPTLCGYVCQLLHDFVAGGVIILKTISNILEDLSLRDGSFPRLAGDR